MQPLIRQTAGCFLLALCLSMLGGSPPAVADDLPHYSLVDIGTATNLSANNWGSRKPDAYEAVAVNKNGQVLGRASGPSGTPGSPLAEGFLWDAVHGMTMIGFGNLYSDSNQRPTGMNSSASIVGWIGVLLDTPGWAVPVMWPASTSNQPIALPGPYKLETYATGINDAGYVVGYTGNASTPYHTIIWTPDRQIADIGVPTGYTSSVASSVNNANQVVGTLASASPTAYRAYVWSQLAGTTVLSPLQGDAHSTANRINDAGQIAGYSFGNGDSARSCVWNADGSTVDIGAIPGYRWSVPRGMNKQGQVVGTSQNPDASWAGRAWLWDSHFGMVDLNTLVDASGAGWTLTSANDINDKGFIAGTGIYNGHTRAFLLKPTNVAQVFANRVYFQAKDQSLWGPGPGRFDYDYFLGPEWNVDKVVGGFRNFYIGPWDCWLFTIPAINLGEFGARAQLTASGKAGLQLTSWADIGTVNLNYPVVVKLQFPDVGAVQAGQPFTLSSSWYTDPAASLSTTSPKAYASVDAVFKADTSATLRARAFSNDLCNWQIVPGALRHIDVKRNLFQTPDWLTTGTWSKDFTLPGGYVSGHMQIPRLATAGSVNPDGVDPHSIGAGASDTFFSIRGNVSGMVASYFGLPLSANVGIELGPVGHATAGYNLLELDLGGRFGVTQQFGFTATPQVRLVFADGTPDVVFNAGDSIQLSMPDSARMTVTPTIMLPNSFSNSTSLRMGGLVRFVPLEVHASASAFGYNLGGFSYTPWAWQMESSRDVPLYRNTFEVGGFKDYTSPPITVIGAPGAAPLLDSVLPDDADAYILPGAVPRLQDFKGFAAGSTDIVVSGSNFATGPTQAFFSIYGAVDVPLATTVLSGMSLRATLPNWFRLLPGTGRLVVTNHFGRSNSLDFHVNYPIPRIATIGPNLWACDPHFFDMVVSVEPDNLGLPAGVGTTYIRRLDYFSFVSAYWAQTAGMPSPTAEAFFPGFHFSADAVLPTIYWNHVPGAATPAADSALGRYVEPTPSGLLVALLPQAYFDRPNPRIPVYIANPGPGGGVSNVVYATVGAVTPAITAITPSAATPGSPDIALVVTGPFDRENPGHPLDNRPANFVATSTVYWNGVSLPTTFVSTSELHAHLPAQAIAVGAVNWVTVRTPGIAVPESNALSFTVSNPAPTVSTLGPDVVITSGGGFAASSTPSNPALGSRAADTPLQNLSVNGTGFAPNSTVLLNGSPRAATVVSDNLIQVTLLPSDVAQPGQHTLTVVSPAPGGGTSNAALMTVQNASPGPTTDEQALWIKRVTPSASTTGAVGVKVVVGGTAIGDVKLGNGMCPGSVVLLNGHALPTTFVSTTAVEASIAPTDILDPGDYLVTVSNPAPGGGVSNALRFSVTGKTRAGISFSLFPVSGSVGETIGLRSLVYSGGAPVAKLPIHFYVDGDPVGDGTSDAVSALRSYWVPAKLTPGVHNVTVTFDGNASYKPATRTSAVLTVRANIGLSIYAAQGVPGETITLRSLVYSGGSPAIGVPVRFSVDGAYAGTAGSDAAGSALSYKIPASMAPGTHSITVAVDRNAWYNAATRTTACLKVGAPKANVAFSLYAVSGSPGQTVTLKALLYSGGAPATGLTVQFAVDGTPAGSATSDISGASAPYVIPSSMSPGSHNVTVAFAGDATHSAATRTSAVLTVK